MIRLIPVPHSRPLTTAMKQPRRLVRYPEVAKALQALPEASQEAGQALAVELDRVEYPRLKASNLSHLFRYYVPVGYRLRSEKTQTHFRLWLEGL